MGDTDVSTRRWIDKALLGAIAVLISLVGLLYGALARGQSDLDTRQRVDSQRITITEQRIETTSRDVTEIKGDVKVLLQRTR